MDASDKKLEEVERTVVAQIDVNWISPSEQYLMDYTTCPLCGTELDFSHNTDFIYLNVEEEANCPHCKIRTKKETHKLQ